MKYTRKGNMKLTPVSDLVLKEDKWCSIGEDPHFILEGKFKSGWNRFEWYSEAAERIPLKLYWDNGHGFDESRSINFSSILKGRGYQKGFVFIPHGANRLRIDTGEKLLLSFVFNCFTLKKVFRGRLLVHSLTKVLEQDGVSPKEIYKLAKKVLAEFRTNGAKSLWAKIKRVGLENKLNYNDYSIWVDENTLTEHDQIRIKSEINNFEYLPLISIILPVYNVDEIWLRKCIQSVQNQLYTNWELCIADDASTKPHIRKVLDEYMLLDTRIKVVYRESNGHISACSNSALEIATGEFVGLLDHDDELTIDALYENVMLLNAYPDTDMIYSDEDKISVVGKRHSPFFKPDWSPDMLLSQMYTCHFSVYRKKIIQEVGGFRKGFEGSQDYDLVLRITERTNRIKHISKVLYHWRTIACSTASSSEVKNYTSDVGIRALNETIQRRGYDAEVRQVEGIPNLYILNHMPTSNPLVSIIIPTRNMGEVLDKCLQSIFRFTQYDHFEVIVIDNGTDDEITLELFEYWINKEIDRFRVIRADIPFNYSKLNNIGVNYAKGDLILLLNNDIEVISESWLSDMAGQAIRKEVGVVGACLLYPDNTIQHAGVVLGIGGVAGHSHKYFDSNENGYFSRIKMVSNYSAVTAACLMVKKTRFLEVGGLEEELAVAFNDVDFCLKIREKGYNNVWLPHVKLYHHESKSRGHEDTPEKIERFNREVNYMKKKWGEKLEIDPHYSNHLTKDKEDFGLCLK
nr:glycosyltransferase family 2 protein [Paenibacillus terrigena]